jgi:hypothetical protein
MCVSPHGPMARDSWIRQSDRAYGTTATRLPNNGWSMNRIGAYNNRTAVIMGVVLSCQLLTGTGFFCAGQFPYPTRVSGNAPGAAAATVPGAEDFSQNALSDADSRGGTLPCTCKKQKKCPAIPRAAIASHPNHRISVVQHPSGSGRGDSLARELTDRRLASGCAPPFMKVVWGSPSYFFAPLEITCVLLI